MTKSYGSAKRSRNSFVMQLIERASKRMWSGEFSTKLKYISRSRDPNDKAAVKFTFMLISDSSVLFLIQGKNYIK